MSRRLNTALIGIFFIIAGILFILRNTLYINIWYLLLAFAGVELLISYLVYSGFLGLVFGSWFTYSGICHLIPQTLIKFALISSTIYFVPTIIFFILFLREHKHSHLVWLLIFLTLGLNSVVNILSGIDVIGTLLICIGIVFILDYLFSHTYIYTAKLNVGIVFIILGILKLADIGMFINYLIPAVLIWIGVMFLIKMFRRDL